jgi:hypothetical protein
MNSSEPMDMDLAHEVQRLREVVAQRDQEIVELRSHLDKYQAVFSFSGASRTLVTPLSPRPTSAKKRTRTRLYGISGDPAAGDSDSVSAGGRDQQSCPTFPKDQTYVMQLHAFSAFTD